MWGKCDPLSPVGKEDTLKAITFHKGDNRSYFLNVRWISGLYHAYEEWWWSRRLQLRMYILNLTFSLSEVVFRSEVIFPNCQVNIWLVPCLQRLLMVQKMPRKQNSCSIRYALHLYISARMYISQRLWRLTCHFWATKSQLGPQREEKASHQGIKLVTTLAESVEGNTTCYCIRCTCMCRRKYDSLLQQNTVIWLASLS